MPPFLYRCPTAGYGVRGFAAEEVPAGGETREAVTRIACQRVHLVNPATAELDFSITFRFGRDDE
jgi:hypothetical protein